jgi:hypothetical protein
MSIEDEARDQNVDLGRRLIPTASRRTHPKYWSAAEHKDLHNATEAETVRFRTLLHANQVSFHRRLCRNDTVRGWREFDSIYARSLPACAATTAILKGAHSTVRRGLLRPAIPSDEILEAMAPTAKGKLQNFAA